jgi:hypothetical protein
VRIDALAVRLRPRTPMEAADLGARLCQSASRSVYACYAMVALPTLAVSLATFEIAPWLPGVLIWCAKPWLDRTILFVLARAAFGQHTTPADVWRARQQVWWRRAWFTWSVRRLSPWRSLTEPVYQLEGLPIREAGARVRQIKRRSVGSAFLMTQTFYLTETLLFAAMLSLLFWFAPAARAPSVASIISAEAGSPLVILAWQLAYACVVLFLEPFYVAAGFGMYLNRRAELEAWDIEQEFRRAFAQ